MERREVKNWKEAESHTGKYRGANKEIKYWEAQKEGKSQIGSIEGKEDK